MANEKVTKEQITDAIKVAVAVGELIQAIGSIPSGHVYAMVQGKLSIDAYESCIRMLINARLVRRDAHHMLTWIGGPSDTSQENPPRT